MLFSSVSCACLACSIVYVGTGRWFWLWVLQPCFWPPHLTRLSDSGHFVGVFCGQLRSGFGFNGRQMLSDSLVIGWWVRRVCLFRSILRIIKRRNMCNAEVFQGKGTWQISGRTRGRLVCGHGLAFVAWLRPLYMQNTLRLFLESSLTCGDFHPPPLCFLGPVFA